MKKRFLKTKKSSNNFGFCDSKAISIFVDGKRKLRKYPQYTHRLNAK